MPDECYDHQPLFQLSQSHLSCLTICPRKFEYIYLEQINSPQPPEHQARQELGSRFHWLMQQQELGLPITHFVQADPDLQRWFDAFAQSPPPILPGQRLSEYRQTLVWDHYLLIAVYDLVILGDQQAQILDWKTYSRPQDPRSLQHNWQTRLYLFLLVETSDYEPAQVSMTYWFAETRDRRKAARKLRRQPQTHSLTFPYSPAAHEQTRQDLGQILNRLDQWLACYRQGQKLPQVEISSGHCYGPRFPCSFLRHCQRQPDLLPSLTTDLELIPEVSL